MSWDQVALAGVGAIAGYGGAGVQSFLSDRRAQRDRCRQEARAARDAVDALRRAYYDAAFDKRDLDDAAPAARQCIWDLRRDGALICDAALRERIAFVVSILQSLSGIEQAGGGAQRSVAWTVSRFAWESLSAHLRGDRLPPEPSELQDIRGALEEYIGWMRDAE